MLKLGIVGLPNVGKSSLFNALTAAGAAAENYPFCTVEPNVGMVEVPDPRLHRIANIVRPKKTVPAVVQFVDIAGLVKGASQGEGLGNKFLANIRETDAIVHVVRCFEDPDVPHVMGSVDPARDREVIEFELALSDLATVEKRLDRTQRAARIGDKDAQIELPVIQRANDFLKEGRGLWEAGFTPEQSELLRPLSLLTVKPILYAANVTEHELAGDEGKHVRALRDAVSRSHEPAEIVPFSARIEAELSELRGTHGIPAPRRHRVRRSRPTHPRRVSPARARDVLHRRRAGGPGLDHSPGRHGAHGGGRDPQRFRARFHSRRDRELRRLHDERRLEGRA